MSPVLSQAHNLAVRALGPRYLGNTGIVAKSVEFGAINLLEYILMWTYLRA